ncbi:hypothetical protein KAW65_08725 [candidate division WOR-3 bacterium]|nr:hypothetical protein [candidate division WOR-3 bacterium]
MIIVLSGTSYAQQLEIGIKPLFRLAMTTESNGCMETTSETWVGGLGTLEYDFFRTLGIEIDAGYYYSLGGKKEGIIESIEFKTDIIPIYILLKYYFPLPEWSKIHLYLSSGGAVFLKTYSEKRNNKYEKYSTITLISFPNPLLSFGLDYNIFETIKVGLVIDLSFISSSKSIEGKGNQNLMDIILSGGVAIKYCFDLR